MDFALESNKTRSTRRARVVRVVAVFFLLSAAADLTMPQIFCRGEMSFVGTSIAHSSSSATESARTTMLASSSDDSQSPQPDEQAPRDEDCFCCCAHVLPSTFAFTASVLVDESSPTFHKHDPPTVASHSGIYRPPRTS